MSSHDHRKSTKQNETHGQNHDHQGHHAHMAADFKRRFRIGLVLTLPVLVLSPTIGKIFGFKEAVSFPGSNLVLLGLATAIFLYGGYPFMSGLYDELKKKSPGMMTLIGLAITVAYFYSGAVALGLEGRVFFWELATLIDIMLLGHWLEMRSVMSASRALDKLAELMPDTAHRLNEDGSTGEVPVEDLEKGDRYLVKPGEKIPADGRVVDGRSKVNESAVTGESAPAAKEKGQEVIGGTVNQDGSLTVEVEKVGEDTFLSQVMQIVKESREAKSKSQNLADRAAFWLTVIAVSVGLITLVVWLALDQSFVFAMERMVTVMVITCPHALGLAVPLVVSVYTSLAAVNGLMIRNRTAFEEARNITAVAFDKTGTLTEGNFGVGQVIALDKARSREEILAQAAALEARSEHPIAKGILAKAKEMDITPPKAGDFENIQGKGIKGRVDGREVHVAGPGWLEDQGLDVDSDEVNGEYDQGRTVVFVVVDRRVWGAISLGDTIRDASRETIEALRDMGIESYMITGDKEQVASRVADALNLDGYWAGVLPRDKVDRIKELQNKGHKVAMTGDGVNDAPALAAADLGLAVGAGTDVAIETADLILVKSNPKDMLKAIRLSRATRRKMVQNLFWATGYNVIAIPLAAGVLHAWGIVITPAMGAAIMSLSTIIAAVNAKMLRLDEI